MSSPMMTRMFGFLPDDGAGDCAFVVKTHISARLSAANSSFVFIKLFDLEEIDRYTEPLCRGLAFFEKLDLEWRTLRENCVQFAVMSARDAGHKNSGFHRRTPKIGKTPEQGDLKNISEVKVDRVDRLRVAEAIERFSGARFLVPNKRDDFVNDRFVNNTARSPQEESEVLVKRDVWRKLHPRPVSPTQR